MSHRDLCEGQRSAPGPLEYIATHFHASILHSLTLRVSNEAINQSVHATYQPKYVTLKLLLH